MAPNFSISFFLLLLLSAAAAGANLPLQKQTFIVIVDPMSKPYPFPSQIDWYSSLLTSSSSRIHNVYSSLLHGFAAILTPTLSHRLRSTHGILAVHRDRVLHPHTTRSPSFLGLDPPFSLLSNLSLRDSSDVIIAVVDTGIWPESLSFSDRDLPDLIPDKWRGDCEVGERFNGSNCNRKLIGARFFRNGYSAYFEGNDNEEIETLSARDSDGHGSHVVSIAAGSLVTGVNFDGFAGGIARGMAPKARIAVYKVCWDLGCLVSDVVSAIESAVLDGVDVISLSVGSASPTEFYYLDPLAITTFRAVLRGVFVAASAGNGGPEVGSVGNAPPWVTTVGAATIDRDFPTVVSLGDGQDFGGRSISITTGKKLLSGQLIEMSCRNLSSLVVKDRFVFWEADRHVLRIEIGADLKRIGAMGMIIFHGDLDPQGLIAEPHVIPTVTVGSLTATYIKQYIRKTKDPTITIFSQGTRLLPGGTSTVVASFSSRGPNLAVPWILKPDIVGPGVNILGAWTDAVGTYGLQSDVRRSEFNIMSGTSMACPHVSGVAALIKAVHPEWSPSEIRSALMTTSRRLPVLDESTGKNADAFALGAGYLDPNRAVDPGLVYDIEDEDYMMLLCGLNYKEKDIKAMSGRGGVHCVVRDGLWRFNYPGFVVEDEVLATEGEVEFERRLKMVKCDSKGSWYRAEVVGMEGYKVEVEPQRLSFNGRVGERIGFKLSLRWDHNKGNNEENRYRNRGMLRWIEEKGDHIVGSPILTFSSGLIRKSMGID